MGALASGFASLDLMVVLLLERMELFFVIIITPG